MMCGLKSPVLNGIEDRNCILKKKLKKLMVLQYVLTKVQELQFGLVNICPIGIAIRIFDLRYMRHYAVSFFMPIPISRVLFLRYMMRSRAH